MKKLSLLLILAASPAFAASGPFFSMANTNFVVLLAFILFIAVLVHFGVPGMLAGFLDKRADDIRSELDEARILREEAQTILASYERKHEEVKEQAARIVEHAKAEAASAANAAKEDLKATIARRLQGAEDQIASAQASAVKEVRDRAIVVAVAAAGDVITKKMTAADSHALVDAAIADVDAKMH